MLTNAPAVLNVNAFEHLMFADDRIETPMTFFLRMTLTSTDGTKLEHERLREAIGKAITRHPLLQSTIAGSPHHTSRKLKWMRSANLVMPFIEFGPMGAPLTFATKGGALDITKEIGVRLFVREEEARWQIIAQFHHSAVDAKGGAKFLEDILACYHASAINETPDQFLTPLDPDKIEIRSTFGLTSKDLWRRILIDLHRIGLYFRYRPEVLGKGHAPTRAAFPADHRFELRGFDIKNLKDYAKKNGVTVNDVLLRDLFHTLDDWNSTHLKKRGRKSIRLAMAVNMRRGSDELVSAANVVSMVFLDRKPEALQDSTALLQSIAKETQWIKDNYLGMALIRASRGFARIRSGLKMILLPNPIYPCHSTAVLSNLGQMFQTTKLPLLAGKPCAGGLCVTTLELLPPFRPNTPFAVGVATVGDTMSLTMNYDSRILAEADAREIINNFSTRVLSNSAESFAESRESENNTLVPLRPIAKSGRLWGLAIGKNVRPEAPREPHIPSLPAQTH